MSDLNEQLKTWPAEIWLQHGCDELRDYAEVRGNELTWCVDNINESDVRYVRADLAPAAAAAAAPVAASVKPWEERLPNKATTDELLVALVGEIADWRRAALAAVPAAAPIVQPDNRLDDVLSDMLAIQEVCGLHTDEYAPGSVIEYIKELEADAAPTASTADAKDAARDVLAERRRQVEVEGWTPERDDTYRDGQMAVAAGYYALASGYPHERDIGRGHVPSCWPWAPEWWKPRTARENLIKAGALILAEIERIDRAAIASSAGEVKS